MSREFGYDRGLPIDRYYIERFLETPVDVAGRTLEIGDDEYTRRYGGGRATRRDVLHVHAAIRRPPSVGDLTARSADRRRDSSTASFTQTLHLIYEVDRAIATSTGSCVRAGLSSATLPGIGQLSTTQWSRTWSWARLAARAPALRLRFGERNVTRRGSRQLACRRRVPARAQRRPSSPRANFDRHEAGCELLVAVRAVR